MWIKLFLFYKWHGTWLNLAWHFATSVAQITFVLLFFKSWNLLYLVSVPLIPWLTDGIGHLCEGNFKEVMKESKENGGTNAVNVNGWTNFILRLIALPYALYKKRAIPTFRDSPLLN